VSTREPIFAALATLVFNNAAIAGAFNTTGRFLRHFDDVADEQCPALFLIQTGETHVRKGKGIPVLRTLSAKFVMYVATSDPNVTLPATLANLVADVLDDSINIIGTPDQAQTLGGLCEHVYTEGAVVTDEGLLQNKSIVVFPVRILIP
jgi:hypothetical protein